MTTQALVNQHADLVERLAGTDQTWSLRLDDCTPDQRIELIEHHGKVMRELRRRGRYVRAGIGRDEHGFECIKLRLVEARQPLLVEEV